MKKIFRLVLTASLAAALAIGATACGTKKETPSTTPPSTETPADTTDAAPEVEPEATPEPELETEPEDTADVDEPSDDGTAQNTDGSYYAEQADFDANSGYKENVTLTISGGKIVAAVWDATHKDGGDSKRVRSKDGSYGMLKAGATAEWVDHADAMGAQLVATQSVDSIDIVSGVTIHIDGFQALVPVAYAKAESGDKLAAGTYKDGVYYAEQADFDANSGWKDNVTVTIQGGKITDVNWNSVHKDGGEDKKTRSKNGSYGMLAANAQSEWFDQAGKMEAELMRKQDPAALVVADTGYTDAVSGVSIHVNGFQALATEALAQAK